MKPSTRFAQAASYGRAFHDVYDDWYAHHDVEPIVAALRPIDGPILELGIGTGRIALALADNGAEVWGLDASSEMLDALRAKPGAERIRTFEADMAGFEIETERFSVVLAAFNVMFNLADHRAMSGCFASCAAVMRPGGLLVVDSAVIGRGDDTAGAASVADIDSAELVLTVSVQHCDEQVIRGQHIEVDDGNVSLRPWRLHYASPDELDALAGGVGLEPVRRCSDWTGRPFSHGDARHVSWYRSAS